jgi:hypothetical protein
MPICVYIVGHLSTISIIHSQPTSLASTAFLSCLSYSYVSTKTPYILFSWQYLDNTI